MQLSNPCHIMWYMVHGTCTHFILVKLCLVEFFTDRFSVESRKAKTKKKLSQPNTKTQSTQRNRIRTPIKNI